jgi:hypothetical protein
MKAAIVSLTLLTVSFTGCATQNYYWGNYEPALYAYYKNPGEVEDFTERLGNLIEKAEQRSKKVPPGIYAEYGYMLLIQGKNKEAITNFKREKQEWPESTYLMDSMIKNAAGGKPGVQQDKYQATSAAGGN